MKFSRYGSEVGYHSHFKTFKTFDAKTLSLVTDRVELFFNETIHTLLKTHFHKRNDFIALETTSILIDIRHRYKIERRSQLESIR